MNPDMEELASIEPGDSNEVCLAKTMLALDDVVKAGLFRSGGKLEPLLADGIIYADEVLNARD